MQTPIRIVISGSTGKMGLIAKQAIDLHPGLSCCGEITRQDSFKETLQQLQPDVLLDVTEPGCVFRHTEVTLELGIRPVIGTSGLTEVEIKHLTQLAASNSIGGLIVPNFSIAAVLMMQCAKLCAKHLPNAQIIEAHHPQKKDAPSGTAIKTAGLIAENRAQTPSTHQSQETLSGVLGYEYQGVAIHSLRHQGVIADQTVQFSNTGETLSIMHRTLDRGCFISGITLACCAVMDLDVLVYGLEHVLLMAEPICP